MRKVIRIHGRGALTSPKGTRRRPGVRRSAQVVAEETDGGILLRLGLTFPVEMHSEKRLAEFRQHNEESLAGCRLKRK
jgi:bifunctional DNA-binding transcriptional regulator/antitoxin component of YhaV-PrlF toxin-antitoxin module